jgi:MFS family permease
MAQIVSEIGDWLYAVAVYSLVLEVTGSAQAVALAFVLQVLPQFFVAPAAGVLNDRVSRKHVMIAADLARAVITFLMLFARTASTLWFLYILLFLETVFWALFEPGRNAVIPNITQKGHQTVVANALSSMTWSFNLAVGSAIGGLIAAAFGRDTVFVVNALSFVVSALLLSAMRFREPHLEALPPFRVRDLADFSPIAEGVRYVRTDPRLMATMLVKAGVGIMATNWIILPVLGERIFRVNLAGVSPESAGMLGMSLLMGSRGIGALLGPLIATRWSGGSEYRFRIGIVAGFLTAAIGYLALGQMGTLLGACVAIVVAHSGASTVWVFSTTMLQLRADDRFRGRVFSAEFAFSMVTMSAMTYGGGVLVDRGMSVWTLATATGLMALVPGAAWAFAQRLWRTP